MVTEKFGEFIRIERLKKRMTQKDLSAVSEVSVSRISEIESGAVPTLKTAEALSGGVGWMFSKLCKKLEQI